MSVSEQPPSLPPSLPPPAPTSAPPPATTPVQSNSSDSLKTRLSASYSVSDMMDDLSSTSSSVSSGGDIFEDCDDQGQKTLDGAATATTSTTSTTSTSATAGGQSNGSKSKVKGDKIPSTRSSVSDTTATTTTTRSETPPDRNTETTTNNPNTVQEKVNISTEDVYNNADALLRKKQKDKQSSRQVSPEKRVSSQQDGGTLNAESGTSKASSEPQPKLNYEDYQVSFDEDVIYENVSLKHKQKMDTLASGEHYGWSSSEFEDYEDSPPGGDSSSVTSKEGQRGSESSGLSHQNSVMKLASRLVPKSIKRHSNMASSIDEDTVEENALYHQIELMDTNSMARLPATRPASSASGQRSNKRRLIVESLLDSENSFVDSLRRIVKHYEKPLLISSKPIISVQNCRDIFYKIKDILYCHLLFNLELSEYAKNWDDNEEIGRVFAASFSKSTVFEAYSGFVKNFSKAMETAKKLANSKPAFASFLAARENESPDRLSLFGLMVKPVQRFPQFIMLFQDLLNHTSYDHKDRMLLQMALTELETLTLKLNESKRDADSRHEADRIITNLSGIKRAQATHAVRNSRFSQLLKNDISRYMIRSDSAIEIDASNGDTKEKERKLFLMNDMILCTSKTSKVHSSDNTRYDQYTYKWSALLSECTIIESIASKVDKTAAKKKLQKAPSPDTNNDYSTMAADISQTHPFKRDITDIVYDLHVMEEIAKLTDKLRLYYKDVNKDIIEATTNILKLTINQKCTVDDCLLQISMPDKNGKVVHLLQMESSIKQYYWLTDIEDAKLSRESWNCPAWYVPENDFTFYSKRPLFVKPIVLDDIKSKKSRVALKTSYKSNIQCATTVCIPLKSNNSVGIQHLWLCNGDQGYSQVSVISLNTARTRVIECFKATDQVITCCEYAYANKRSEVVATVWHGVADNTIIIFTLEAVGCRKQAFLTVKLPHLPVVMRYSGERMYVGLDSGDLLIFNCILDKWDTKFVTLKLSEKRLTCLFEVGGHLWVSSGQKLYAKVDTKSYTTHELTSDSSKVIGCVAKAGVGLLISYVGGATIHVYHGESLESLQDIDVISALNIQKLCITTLKACSGLLWVGTNCGRLLTLPLPRLQGVPKIKGRPCVALHSHSKDQPVRFIASIRCGLYDTTTPSHFSTMLRSSQNASPIHKGTMANFEERPTLSRSLSVSTPCLMDNSSEGGGDVQEIYDSLMNPTSCSELDVNAIVEANGEERTTKKAMLSAASKVDRKRQAFVSNMKNGLRNQLNQHKSSTHNEGKPKRNVKLADSINKDRTMTSTNQSHPEWYNRSIMIASGGDGCVKWSPHRSNEVQSADVRTACLLLWKCRF